LLKAEAHMNAGVKLGGDLLTTLEMLFHNYWYITGLDEAIPSFFRNNPHGWTRTTLSLATCTRHSKSIRFSGFKGSKHGG
jgi:hypothetical protein